ncbi:conserved hypothetical protein [Culex quinquefasciatus]|uniref:TIL domain-containing protein n=1 Tax=Culex quinquefasciatus TaxID=7176 RepID=B0W856_CULQU|nr:conserved hypothetical protein [Culex quinquefasciatus]|eukprot:XP_001844890.1 conserved hypothetical protein [Culex quinquefasciatus]
MKAQLAVLFGLVALLVDVTAFVARVCPINQVQVRKKICCEPTCFDDCTGDACTFTNNTVPNCVCLPGYVRHMGHCIRPKYCPQGCTTPEPPIPCILETTPCDIEEIPTEPPCEPVTTPAPCVTTPAPCPTTPPPCPTTPPPCPTTPPPCAAAPTKPPCGCAAKTTAKPCPPNSTFSSCTPCCEPTCDNDCRAVRCISPCSGEPTCVCNRDYVKQNGRCIPRIFCPNAGSNSSGGGFFGGF